MSRLEDALAEEFRLFGLPEPLRQHKFSPRREFALDFFWPDHRYWGLLIAVEVNGGLYIQGRHNRGAQLEQEYEKIREAVRCGIVVFPFGPKALYVPKRATCGSEALRFMWRVLKGEGEVQPPVTMASSAVMKPRRHKTLELFT